MKIDNISRFVNISRFRLIFEELEERKNLRKKTFRKETQTPPWQRDDKKRITK